LLLFSSFKLAEQAPAGVCVDKKKKVYKGSDRHDHMVFLLHFVLVELVPGIMSQLSGLPFCLIY